MLKVVFLCIVFVAAVWSTPEKLGTSQDEDLSEALNILSNLQTMIETMNLNKKSFSSIPTTTFSAEDEFRKISTLMNWMSGIREKRSDPGEECHCAGNSNKFKNFGSGVSSVVPTVAQRFYKSTPEQNLKEAYALHSQTNLLNMIGKSLQERVNKLKEKDANPFYSNPFFRPSAAKVEHLINTVGK